MAKARIVFYVAAVAIAGRLSASPQPSRHRTTI